MISNDQLRLDIDGGKYTFVQRADGGSHVLRYGEPWLDTLPPGANCWLAMAYELEASRSDAQVYEWALENGWHIRPGEQVWFALNPQTGVAVSAPTAIEALRNAMKGTQS